MFYPYTPCKRQKARFQGGYKSNNGLKKWVNELTNPVQTSQPAFTCSKLTLETLEQGMKYVQSWQ